MWTDGRSPHGERGLKHTAYINAGVYSRRSPHGERGLKLGNTKKSSCVLSLSLPSRGAWIETYWREYLVND